MVLKGVEKLTKTLFHRITVLRKKRRKCKSTADKNELFFYNKTSPLRVKSESKYAKLIPYTCYREEKSRLDMIFNISVDIESLFAREQIYLDANKIYREKHEHIIDKLHRIVGETCNKHELREFLSRTKTLEKGLKRQIRFLRDDDLKSMHKVLEELLRVNDKNPSKLCVPNDNQRTCFIQAKIRRSKKQRHRDVNLNTKPLPTEIPLAKHKHTCEVQQCLLNKTPRKNSKKALLGNSDSEYLLDSGDNPDNEKIETDQIVLKPEKASLRQLLNFRYDASKNKLKCVDAKRFSIQNVQHCKTVAKIVDDRLWGTPVEQGHLVCVYMEYFNGTNKDMSRFMYDMLLKCLETYFFPAKNFVKIAWTSEINNLILKTTGASVVNDIFGRRYELMEHHINAVMILSRSGSDLLRHKQLCVLDTIAVVLDFPRESLLTVHMDTLPQLFG